MSVVGSNEIDLYGISISTVQPPSKRPAAAVEDRIPVAVELRDVAIEAVGAHAVRVQAEEVAAAPIVERIDRDVEPVVLPDVVVLAHVARRDQLGVVVVEPRRDIERIVVVENEHLGALVGLGVLDRRHLVQIVDDGRRRPDRVAQVAVDDGRRRRAHDAHGLLARDPAAPGCPARPRCPPRDRAMRRRSPASMTSWWPNDQRRPRGPPLMRVKRP